MTLLLAPNRHNNHITMENNIMGLQLLIKDHEDSVTININNGKDEDGVAADQIISLLSEAIRIVYNKCDGKIECSRHVWHACIGHVLEIITEMQNNSANDQTKH